MKRKSEAAMVSRVSAISIFLPASDPSMSGIEQMVCAKDSHGGRRFSSWAIAAFGVVGTVLLMLMLSSGSAWAQVTINQGDIVVVDAAAFAGHGGVIRVNPSTGAQTAVSQGQLFVQPAALVIESTGTILVADRNLPGVIRVDPRQPNGSNQTIVHSGAPFVDPFGIAVEANGNILVTDTGCPTHNCPTGGFRGQAVFRVNPTTGAVTVVSQRTAVPGSSHLDSPYGIDVEDSGNIVVTDATSNVAPFTGAGGIIRINPVTGTETAVHVGTAGVDGCPFGIAVQPITGFILNSLLDPNAFPGSGYGCSPGSLWHANPVVDQNTVVSPHSIGWQAPFGMVVDTNNSNTILAVDEQSKALFRVDPNSGAPTLISIANLMVTPTDVSVYTATNTPTPLSGADLSVTKTDGVTTVAAGDGFTYTYTITVSNAGPLSATNVSLTDTWPSGFTRGTTSVTPASQGSCTAGTGSFTCSLGNLPSGTSTTITANFTVPATTPAGTQTNTVSVTSDTSDPNPANNTASDTDVVLANTADLSVAKDDSVTTVTAGDGVTRTYTITVTNNGPSQAVSVNLSDSWPSGFSRGNTTSSAGTCTSGTGSFTCSLGNIAPGASATVTADYTVPATTPAGTQTNTVSVTSSTTDPDSTNNTASDTDTVIAANADLSVTKNDFVTTVMAGDGVTHTYTITVMNNGPSQAVSVNLSDSWPSGFTRGATSPSCTSGTGSFTCSLGNLDPGASATVTANYTVPATTLAGPQTNTVTVSSNTPDNNPANNSASDTDTVSPAPTTSADLSITKTASPNPVNTGAPLTYTLTVHNSGPDTAINLTVTDTLPAGETFVNASGSGWTCNQSGGTVTCTDPTLAAGATTVITINVTAPDNPGTVVNQATVTSDTNDPNSSNNTASASTTVVAPAAKWTGGGQINVTGGTANFGFNVQRKTQNGAVKGHLEYHNHVSGLHVHSIAITSLKVIGNKAIFKGTVDESTNGGPKNGPYNFTVTVQDVDPGRNDTFEIQISDPNGTHEGSSVTPIKRGNIEQH